MACPANSFQYNNTLCACNPGYIFNSTANNCSLFQSSPNDWSISSGIDYSISFSIPIFSFESIKKFTQSQAVFLQATLVLLLSWFVFCLVLRIGKINDGRSLRFRLRWWISRLDVCYATRHWLDDRKVVKKRKTELGGTFSIASWILFIGLFAALLYQIISRRSVEVHNVRASNGPDLLSFINDMEFNITTISSMSCSHLRGLGTLVTGTPGFDYRSSPLSIFANFSCHNTSRGPTIMLRCSNCKIARDDLYISWQFVDLPNNPATAVGFQFNFTAKNLRARKRISFVTGTLKNGSNMDSRPITFRGPDVNILKFHLFPRIYHNLHGLRLIQPLFHEFTPGSSYLGTSQLQASLQSSQDGLINTTLAVNFLSAYIIEIDTENVLGPVGVLADLGGLYAISFAIFFYFLMQAPNFHFLAHSIQKILAELFFVAGMFVAPWAWTFPWFSLSKHLSQRGTFGFLFVLGWQMISGLRGDNLVRMSSLRCEFRIKKLRREDTVLINIRNRTKAKQNWDKLRKYVMYTWDCSSLKDVIKSNEEVPLCDCRGVKSSRASGSLHKRKQEIQMDTINLNKKGNLPTDVSTCSKLIQTQRVKSCSTGQLPDIETGLTCTEGEHVAGHEDSDTQIGKRSKDLLAGSCQGDVSLPQASLLNDITLPLPPALEYKTDSGSDILDVQRNLQNLFEYNVLLREKFIASQSKLEALTKKASDPHCKCHNIT